MGWLESTVKIEVRKPIDEVFGFAADATNMDRWMTGVSEPELTTDGEYGVGTTLRSKYTYGGRTHEITHEVTEYDPPRRHAIKSTSGPYPFVGILDLEAAGEGGTRVTNAIRAGSDHVVTSVMFVTMAPFLRMMMRRQLRKELSALKEVLEAE